MAGRMLPRGASLAGGFVGRKRELGALAAKLTAAFAGEGGMAMLVGEPGIGKTRTAREFAGMASKRGATVLWGRCYEFDWSPPYEPWIDAIRAYVRVADPARLRAQVGPAASLLAQLVPELRATRISAPQPALVGADEARLRLYEAVCALFEAAAGKPVVLVLDDLDCADRDSLDLLEYVARFLGRIPLLIVGTYRSVELDLTHPLAQCLADLNRERLYERLALGSLSGEETARLLEQLWRAPLAPEVAEAIYIETDGNPFFVEEVVRHLQAEGRDPGSLDPGSATWEIPETVRQAVGRRLAGLSRETNRLLSVAVAFTGSFDFSLLQALTGMEEGALLDSIDEALAAKMIRPVSRQADAYEFAHALVRHTLCEELNPSRKARLHRRIARALEQVHAGRESDYSAELAYQYHQSASLPGAAHGIRYALAAAEQAKASYARDHGVGFLRMARDLAWECDSSVRADLLSRLAVAEAEAMMVEDARRSLDEALGAFADAAAPPERAEECVRLVMHALGEADVGEGETAAVVYPDDLTAREVEVLQLLASGRANKEIAAELVVSTHTVERHLANIYGKIGVHNRAGAVRYALEHHLIAAPTV